MNEANNTLAEALADFPIHEPPDTLFRFCRPNDLNLLSEGQLKLTPPFFFNDPFEMFAGIDVSALSEEKVIKSVTAPRSIFRETLKLNNPRILANEAEYIYAESRN